MSPDFIAVEPLKAVNIQGDQSLIGFEHLTKIADPYSGQTIRGQVKVDYLSISF